MIKYKVLKNNLTSPFKGFQYELGKLYECEDFDDDQSEDCSRGFYATDIEGIVYSWKNNGEFVVVEVEVGGRSVELPPYKCRYETQRLNRILSIDEVLSIAREKESQLGYKLSEVIRPINPLLLPEKEVTDRHIQLLKEWASVRASVWASVRASVWDSVRASVWDSVRASVWDSVRASVRASVWDSVWASVGDSVWASVWAYISSLFPNIEKWKYIDHEPGINPFQSGVDLWMDGLVPSFDGETWRLHQGGDAKIVFEISSTKLTEFS